jgi:hypothetical protein
VTDRRTLVAVLAVPGREDYTQATLQALHYVGGAATLTDPPPLLCWTGQAPPSFEPPPGWALCHWQRDPEGHRRDLWRVFALAATPPATDLIVLEDDVLPCRNAIPYMVRWSGADFTTFFNMRQGLDPRLPGLGRRPIDPKWGFWGTQAFKVPALLLQRFVAAGDTDRTKKVFLQDGGDTRIGRLLLQWKEPIYYHRSLVQHVGARSIHNPGATMTGLRAPAADFDPDLDALTL